MNIDHHLPVRENLTDKEEVRLKEAVQNIASLFKAFAPNHQFPVFEKAVVEKEWQTAAAIVRGSHESIQRNYVTFFPHGRLPIDDEERNIYQEYANFRTLCGALGKGCAVTCHENGHVWEWFYCNGYLGCKEGPYFAYNPEQVLVERGAYKGHVKFGFWESFHKTGQLCRSVTYDTNGYVTGLDSCFFLNGQPHYKTNYRCGVKHGESLTYSYDGIKVTKELYENGVRINCDVN